MLDELFEETMEREADQILWRKVEQMSPPVRCRLFGVSRPFEDSYGINLSARHTPFYVRVADAFYDSYEWRSYRRRFLAARPKCERCGAAPSEVVHHVPPWNVARTIIRKGLLWAAEENVGTTHKLRALCSECHRKEHGYD